MFKDTSCLGSNTPKADVGPWCQTEDDNCGCKDNKDIKFTLPNGKNKRTCAKINNKLCKTELDNSLSDDKIKPQDECPTICNKKCQNQCEDDEDIIFLFGPTKKEKGCDKIKVNQCDTKYETKIKRDGKRKQLPTKFCPSICDSDCLDKCAEDKKKKYQLVGQKRKLKCRKIKSKKLCGTELINDIKDARVICPISCKLDGCLDL